MKEYKYPVGDRLLTGLVIVVPSLLIIGIGIMTSHSLGEFLICFSISTTISFFGIVALSEYPNIKVTDEFLYVQFFSKYIPVRWDHVIAVRQPDTSERFSRTRIFIKRQQVFHIEPVGYYKGIITPAFYIHCSIDNYLGILKEIKRRATWAHISFD